ncbi:MAG: hypothetical protein PHE27_04920 [Alphaproteobacteria bacterium]|nr:hypothetical protein [Alphaproteobacteria bacterium]
MKRHSVENPKKHWRDLNDDPMPNKLGLEFRGRTTLKYRKALLETYSEVSPEIRGFLSSRNVRIVGAGTMSDVWSSEEARKFRPPPSKEDSRTEINQSSARYWGIDNTIGIAQHYYVADNPADNNQLTMRGIITGAWRVRRSKESVATSLRHEIGHAFDQNMGEPSRTQSFREACEKDIAAMGGLTQAYRNGWGYYIRKDNREKGQMEAFAEIWAVLNGGEDKKGILSAFPNAAKWVATYQKNFEKAWAKNPEALQNLIDETTDAAYPFKNASIGGNDHTTDTVLAKELLERTKLRVHNEGDLLLQEKFLRATQKIEGLPPVARNMLLSIVSESVKCSLDYMASGTIEDTQEMLLSLSVARQMGMPLPETLIVAIRDLDDYMKKQTALVTQPERPQAKLPASDNNNVPDYDVRKLEFVWHDSTSGPSLPDESASFNSQRILKADTFVASLLKPNGTAFLNELFDSLSPAKEKGLQAFVLYTADNDAGPEKDHLMLLIRKKQEASPANRLRQRLRSGTREPPIVIVSNKHLSDVMSRKFWASAPARSGELAYLHASMSFDISSLTDLLGMDNASMPDLYAKLATLVEPEKSVALPAMKRNGIALGSTVLLHEVLFYETTKTAYFAVTPAKQQNSAQRPPRPSYTAPLQRPER